MQRYGTIFNLKLTTKMFSEMSKMLKKEKVQAYIYFLAVIGHTI